MGCLLAAESQGPHQSLCPLEELEGRREQNQLRMQLTVAPAVEVSFHQLVSPSAGQCHPSPTYNHYTQCSHEVSPKGRSHRLSQLVGYSLTAVPVQSATVLTTVAQGKYRGLSQALEFRSLPGEGRVPLSLAPSSARNGGMVNSIHYTLGRLFSP